MNEINLLPDDYIKKRRRKPKKILKISLAVAVVILLILLSTTVVNRYQQLKTVTAHANKIYNEDLTPLLKKEQKLRETERDITQKYNLFLELQNQKTLLSEILLEIAQLTPENIQIKNIVISNDKSIVISGQARSDTDIAQFMVSVGKAQTLEISILITLQLRLVRGR